MVLFATFLIALLADVRGCICDPAQPTSMQARECSLTRIVADQSTDAVIVFVPDANPTKPNRWLSMPRALRHTLNEMTASERERFWSASIEKARALWGEQWGLAVNSIEKRSQCQVHAHIGKVLTEAEPSGGTLVNRAADIPVPPAGGGIWIHPEGGKLRAQTGLDAPELGLMR